MEEGTKTKRTVFVGGVGEDVDEAALMAAFSTFGTSTLPTRSTPKLTRDLRRGYHRGPAPYRTDKSFTTANKCVQTPDNFQQLNVLPSDTKHRGFAFVTFGSPEDAQDAIDNMDLNELQGRVLKVNLARHTKAPIQGLGNRAGSSKLI